MVYPYLLSWVSYPVAQLMVWLHNIYDSSSLMLVYVVHNLRVYYSAQHLEIRLRRRCFVWELFVGCFVK